jgi:glycosyltransferase involved in cell wall biosynthesis
MDSSHPFISVLITCYNDEMHVARAIESVLQQTFKNYEILLIDNNSTDGTLQIIQEYESRYPRLIRVFQERKQGCPAARNKGLSEAKGQWIQILDSDNELLPKKLEHDCLLAKDSDVEFIASNRVNYRIINNKLHKKVKLIETENLWKALLLFRFCNTNACLIRKKVLQGVNGWNEDWLSVEDYELYYRLFKKGAKLAYNTFTDTIVHKRPNSMSNSSVSWVYIRHIYFAIKTRLLIRDYMRINGLLTKELEQEFEKELFFKLLRWEKKAPDFFEEQLRELKLNVPAHLKLKYQISRYKRTATSKIKSIFKL